MRNAGPSRRRDIATGGDRTRDGWRPAHHPRWYIRAIERIGAIVIVVAPKGEPRARAEQPDQGHADQDGDQWTIAVTQWP